MMLAFMEGGLGLCVYPEDIARQEIIDGFLCFTRRNNGDNSSRKRYLWQAGDGFLVELIVNGLLHCSTYQRAKV